MVQNVVSAFRHFVQDHASLPEDLSFVHTTAVLATLLHLEQQQIGGDQLHARDLSPRVI
jgi:hypothetical protein